MARARLERGAELAELSSRVIESPRMVPLVDGIEAVAERLLAGRLSPEDALEALPEDECKRLMEAFVERHPWELAKALALGDEAELLSIILLASVVGALGDHEASVLPPELLAAIEEDATLAGPIEALAFALDGTRLWDDVDGAEFEREAAKVPESLDDEAAQHRFDGILADVASSRFGDWHARRLGRMVHELRAQLPAHGYPRASALLEQGCARFDADDGLGTVVATQLLVDVVALGPSLDDELPERLAA